MNVCVIDIETIKTTIAIVGIVVRKERDKEATRIADTKLI